MQDYTSYSTDERHQFCPHCGAGLVAHISEPEDALCNAHQLQIGESVVCCPVVNPETDDPHEFYIENAKPDGHPEGC